MTPHFHHRGFIALLSAIILSAALLLISISSASAGFFARATVADGAAKKISDNLAAACVNDALLKLGENYAYAPAAGGDTVGLGADACTIRSVSTQTLDASGKTVSIITDAHEENAYTTLEVSASVPDPAISSGDIRIDSWREFVPSI